MAAFSTFCLVVKGRPNAGGNRYVNEDTARSLNLTYASPNSFIIRADSKTKLASGGKGRKSVRIFSKKMYTTHAAVLDLRHMPQGAGTWPAYWMNGNDWPNGGEWDIIEVRRAYASSPSPCSRSVVVRRA